MRKKNTIFSLSFAAATSVLSGCFSLKTKIESYVPENETCVVVETLKQSFYPEMSFRRTYNFQTQMLTTELSNESESSGKVFWQARNTKPMEDVQGEEGLKRLKKARKKVSHSCTEETRKTDREHRASFIMQRQ